MNSSYTVLARKYRPHSFNEVVGQEHVIEAMKNSLKNNKLHSVYLLSGTRGVGKTTIARIFTEAMNCDNFSKNNEPCGECPSCISFSRGADLDIYEIDGASRTKVEDTKEIIELMQYPPINSKYKVFIIDEVHMLSTASFNALLKTLEEPPEYAKFILCTTDPQKIPATVLSRTLHFQLKPFNEDQIKGQLISILEKEGIPYEEYAVEALARAANGSMRDCLTLADQAIAIGNQKVLTKKVYQMIGLADDSLPLELFSALLSRSTNKVNLILDQFIKDQVDWTALTQQLLDVIYQASIYYLVDPNDRNKFGINNKNLMSILDNRQFNINTYLENTQLLYEIFTHSLKLYPITANPRQVFFLSCIRALNFIEEDINSSLHNQMYERPEPIAKYKNSSKYVTNYLRQKEELSDNLKIGNLTKTIPLKKELTTETSQDIKRIIQEVREEEKAKKESLVPKEKLSKDLSSKSNESSQSNEDKSLNKNSLNEYSDSTSKYSNLNNSSSSNDSKINKVEPSIINDFETKELNRERSLSTAILDTHKVNTTNYLQEKKTLNNSVTTFDKLPFVSTDEEENEESNKDEVSHTKQSLQELDNLNKEKQKNKEIIFKNSSSILLDSSQNSIDSGEDSLGDFIVEEDNKVEEEILSYESLKSNLLLFTASNNDKFKEQYLMPAYSSDDSFNVKMQEFLEKKKDDSIDCFEKFITKETLELCKKGTFRNHNIRVNPQKLLSQSLQLFNNLEELKVLKSLSLSNNCLRFLIDFPFKIDIDNKIFYIKHIKDSNTNVKEYFSEIKTKLENNHYQVKEVNSDDLNGFSIIAQEIIINTYQLLAKNLEENFFKNIIDPLIKIRI